MDDAEARNVEGDLDVDLAELSLGQRLTAVTGADGTGHLPDSSDEDEAGGAQNSRRSRREAANGAVPAASLTRTLIQALHSSDSRLLETCLAHSEATLIRNTVRRLPPQLAVPLITACVERLGRGNRGANMKGRGGGASSQRGTAMIKWIKAVLAAHSGHLMTVRLTHGWARVSPTHLALTQMPDLVARLSGLHATLTMRLTLHESLLALSGRLDMVISQIEMRTSGGPTALPAPRRAGKHRRRRNRKYVEGESEAEEEEEQQQEEQMEVEVESGDDGGSVEDVELGSDEDDDDEDEDEEGDSDEDDSEDEDEDEVDEDDDEDEDEAGPKLNGFIDDEAEEEYSEEEDDEESE